MLQIDHTHPIFSQNYILATPPIEAFANTIRQWVSATIPGGMIYGNTRVGKTYAIDYVIDNAKNIFGYSVPVIKVTWHKNSKMTEKQFYQRILSELNHAFTQGNLTIRLENRVIDYFESLVSKSPGSSIILFIDEAHWLTPNDFGGFCHIYNRLKTRKIQLYTFLVGDPRILETRTTFKQTEDTQFIGRFLWSDYAFEQLDSKDDLAFVLEGYDLYTDYPKDSGHSYVYYFLPKAFSNGWRLATCAPMIWKNYLFARRKVGPANKKVMPMQACTILVTRLLVILSRRDSPDLEITREDIDNAVSMIVHLDS